MIVNFLKYIPHRLGAFGTICLLIILAIGLRNFNVTVTSNTPHVMSFNMYQHSISAKDGSELPDIDLKVGQDEVSFTKAQIAKTTMGYLHISDRWKFYPNLYQDYFCSKKVSDYLGYVPKHKLLKVKISYIKNYQQEVIYEEKFLCQN